MATVCSPFPRQNTVLFYYLSRHYFFLLLSLCPPSTPIFFSSAPRNLACPSMFKTHYMWPSGIYSGALPVTPFRTGVPWEHGEMSSCKAWKRHEEKGTVRGWERERWRNREERMRDEVKSAGNEHFMGVLSAGSWELRRGKNSVFLQVNGSTGRNNSKLCVIRFVWESVILSQ